MIVALHIQQHLALSGENDLIGMKDHEAMKNMVYYIHEVLLFYIFFTLLLLWYSSNTMAIYFVHIPNINICLCAWFKPEQDNGFKEGWMVGNHPD